MSGAGRKQEESGLTRQRQAVLQEIRAREDHPTAGEVFEGARKRLPSISFATVYNSLRYLKQAGLIHEISFGDGASRYDRELDRHEHAICTCCGKLVDLDLPQTGYLLPVGARKSRFEPHSVHLTL